MLRINIYTDNKESFLEIYNPKWNYRSGGVGFSLFFNDGISAEFRGQSYGDSYTYDFLEQDKMLVTLGLIVSRSDVRIGNSNGSEISQHSLKGAADAIGALKRCAGEL